MPHHDPVAKQAYHRRYMREHYHSVLPVLRFCLWCGKQLKGIAEKYCCQKHCKAYLKAVWRLPVIWHCKWCGAIIPNTQGKRRVFCNKAHNHAYYQATDKGKKVQARYWWNRGGLLKARKDDWSALVKYLIYIEQVPCAECGEQTKALLQGDHIIPRAWVVINEVWNCRILCRKCHVEKTRQDVLLMHMGVFIPA